MSNYCLYVLLGTCVGTIYVNLSLYFFWTLYIYVRMRKIVKASRDNVNKNPSIFFVDTLYVFM